MRYLAWRALPLHPGYHCVAVMRGSIWGRFPVLFAPPFGTRRFCNSVGNTSATAPRQTAAPGLHPFRLHSSYRTMSRRYFNEAIGYRITVTSLA